MKLMLISFSVAAAITKRHKTTRTININFPRLRTRIFLEFENFINVFVKHDKRTDLRESAVFRICEKVSTKVSPSHRHITHSLLIFKSHPFVPLTVDVLTLETPVQLRARPLCVYYTFR